MQACSPTTPLRVFQVNYTAPRGQDVTSVTVLMGYDSALVSIPGTGAVATVSQRVKNRPSSAVVAANDLNYALRVILTRALGLTSGRLFTVDFDSCAGAMTPSAADFGCTVETCANAFGNVEGCTCEVHAP